MVDVSNHTWKYLREYWNGDFNYKRHTALPDYLAVIYPGYEFIYDKPIPKEVINSRYEGAEIRKFRPDARCEELNLVVEFDGLPHYQDTSVILKDKVKDAYLARLGYKVVRIPYWIQLTNPVIEHLFGVIMKTEMCTLTYSFSDTTKGDFGLSICPGNMCEAGRQLMIEQFKSLPKVTQKEVLEDLQRCIDNKPENCPNNWIVPNQLLETLARIAMFE